MKKLFFYLALFCGIALLSTSCNKENQNQVEPETNAGTLVVGSKTLNITTSKDAAFGNQHAIVFASEQFTNATNNGLAVIFDGPVTPGHYVLGDPKTTTPKVVGLKDFNMGELQAVIAVDTLNVNEVYYWVSGELSIAEENGTYTVVLSQCVAVNHAGNNISLSVNFTGTLSPFVINTDNKFIVDGKETAISLAGYTSIGLSDTVGHFYGTRSMVFMSPNHKVAFIVSYLNSSTIDGTYQLSALIPYLPALPCVHYATDFDFWSATPQTGYVAESGTLKVQTDSDGVRTVTITNAKLRNLEHPNSIFFPVIDASLQYQGLMYEIGN